MLTTRPSSALRIAPLVVLVLAATGCGRLAGPSGGPQADQPLGTSGPVGAFGITGTGGSTPEGYDVPARDWSHPIDGDWALAPDAGALAKELPFDLYVPQDLGPVQLFSPPPSQDGSVRGVILVIQSPEFGVIWWSEATPTITDEAERLAYYEGIVAQNGDPTRHVVASIVTIRNGVPALVGAGDDGLGLVRWVEAGVEYQVIGETLNADEALKVAETG